jgi:hypothetical protein
MSVTKVVEDWQGLSCEATATLSGTQGTLTRKFVVTFDTSDSPSYRPILALDASHGGVSVPAFWSVHASEANCFVISKSVAPENGPFNFAVTVKYDYIENPLLQPYSIQFIPQATQEAIDKAIELDEGDEVMTKNLCNSAHEPFDPPIQEEFYDTAIIIKRNEAAFDMSLAKDYFNKVNSDVFEIVGKNGIQRTFAVGTVLCKSIQADEVRHGPTWYYAVTYEFVMRDDGWKRRLLDQGFRKISGSSYLAIADTDGNPVTQPAKLNGSGDLLAIGDTAVFLEFQTKYTKPFLAFNFA